MNEEKIEFEQVQIGEREIEGRFLFWKRKIKVPVYQIQIKEHDEQ